MNLKFTYTNKKGETEKRNLIVIHESDTKLAGVDLGKLSRSDNMYIRKVFGSKPVTPFPETRTKINYTDSRVERIFKEAYRMFNKDSIR